jgi:hypothetical protein
MSLRRESEFARLKQLLWEADKQAEQERRRAEDKRRIWKEADKRVEQEQRRAEEADERAEQERRRAEDAKEKTKPIILEEYLRVCYTFLSKPLRIQIDKSLST